MTTFAKLTRGIVVGLMAALLALGVACSGGEKTAAPAPQQPAPATQPAPAAPAPAPKPAVPAAPAVAEPKYGGIMVLANRGDPALGWDPMRSDNFDLTMIQTGITGSANLVRGCREDVYKICAGLAESWEANSDFTQWTFKVRDNVLWHDGTPFTAEDVKFWLELAYQGAKSPDKTRNPAWYRANLGDLQKVEALPGNRLRVTLGRRSPQYISGIQEPRHTLAHPRHLMQKRIEQGEVNIAPLDVGLVGTGPFKFLNWEKGTRAQVRRFDKYWEKDAKGRQLPYLDGIDFAIMRDPGAMDAAFRTGLLDGGARGAPYYLTPERKTGYVKDLGDKVWFTEIGAIPGGLSFNVVKPGPLQDVRVRKAISLWLDRVAFINALYGGLGEVGPFLNPRNPFTGPDFKTWPGFNQATKERDRAEAKRLLAEAGYATGVKINILIPTPRFLPIGEFFQAQMRDLGINLEMKLVDEAGFAAGRLTVDNDTLYGYTFALTPESTEGDMQRFSLSKLAGVKHEDPKVSEFFVRLSNATTYDQRLQIWRELERYYVLDQVYTASMGGNLNLVPYRSYVKGLFVPAERVHEDVDHVTVWLDK